MRLKTSESRNPWRLRSEKPRVSGEFPEGWTQKRWLFSALYGKKRGAERGSAKSRAIRLRKFQLNDRWQVFESDRFVLSGGNH